MADTLRDLELAQLRRSVSLLRLQAVRYRSRLAYLLRRVRDLRAGIAVSLPH